MNLIHDMYRRPASPGTRVKLPVFKGETPKPKPWHQGASLEEKCERMKARQQEKRTLRKLGGRASFLQSLPADIATVVKYAARTMKIRPIDILIGDRPAHVLGRAGLCVRLHNAGYSTREIGRWLNLTHSTVRYHVEKGRNV